MRLIAMALLAALVAACGGAAESSTTQVPTTTIAILVTTTTTAQLTTTTTQPTTTTTEIDSESSYWKVLGEERLYLAEAIEGAFEFGVQSVDRVIVDPASRTVAISVTSVWSTTEYRTDLAWEIYRALARTLYSTTLDQGKIAPQIVGLWESWGGPTIELVVDDLAVLCQPDFLRGMVDLTVDRQDWERDCVG